MATSIAARRPEKALTAQFVRSVRIPGKYFDGNGLFLRVQPNGSKQWVQRIVVRGKRCEIGLGSPVLVSLAEARERALEHRKLARTGGDPLAKKREAEAVLTFEAAARRVHQLHLPTWRNEKHGRDFITSLEAHAFPRIGKLKVAEVMTSDVLAVLSPIWTDKAETARRVRQRIGTVMKWAIAQGWRQDNPACRHYARAPQDTETQGAAEGPALRARGRVHRDRQSVAGRLVDQVGPGVPDLDRDALDEDAAGPVG